MNKYKSLIIVMFFIFTFSIYKVYANVNDLPLLGRVIYLDAGHGGVDDGARSNNIVEKDVNVILVKKLEKKLIGMGAIVYLTRDGDYDLSTTKINRKRSDLYNRAKMINESNADIYISIHLNSTDSSKWRGLQVFYNDINSENLVIAKCITDILKNNISNVREVKKVNTYYMYKKIKIPGILIETGFISNASDNYLLRDSNYQDKLINNITNGIISYFNNG